MRFFAACPPGLEALVAGEVRALDLPVTPLAGGVESEGNIAALYRLNLHLRCASRVLLRVGEFSAPGFEELRRRAGRIPWEQWLRSGKPLALRVTCHKSRLYHSGAVAQRLAEGIGQRLGGAPSLAKAEEDPGSEVQTVVCRLEHDHCTLSVDSSGELLHRRGYRLRTAKAPLRENLAAALLVQMGYDGSRVFIDPFCGSGTLPIEAALLSTRTAPGLRRSFQFMNWAGFEPRLWESLTTQARESIRAADWPILGFDRDAGAVLSGEENAQRAGMGEAIQFACQPISALRSEGARGLVVTNPPYGQRVSKGNDLRNLYAQFGNVIKRELRGWSVAYLCNDRVLAGHSGLHAQPVLQFANGGIAVALYAAQIPG